MQYTYHWIIEFYLTHYYNIRFQDYLQVFYTQRTTNNYLGWKNMMKKKLIKRLPDTSKSRIIKLRPRLS